MELENEDLIRRFLLGKMSEKERLEFEERFVADTNLIEQIIAVEDDLIEKYVRGWMRPEESAEFETVFLVTRKRRERIEFARTFIDQITGTGVPVTDTVGENAPKQPYFASVRPWFRIPNVALAGALGVLIVFVGVWMFVQLFTPNRPELAVQPSNGAQPSPASTRSPEAVTAASPTNPTETPEPTTNTDTPEPVPAAKKTPAPTKSPAVEQPVQNPVLALFPGILRSGGSNNVLKLPSEAKAATFLLNLPSTDHSTYAALVTDADGNTIAQFDKLKASNGRVRIVVGANQLKKGDYMIKLDGGNVSGELESVADFQFRVKQQ